MAMLVDGDAHKVAIWFLAHEHSYTVAGKVQAAWEPQIFPPPGHPLATGELAKDMVLVTLR